MAQELIEFTKRNAAVISVIGVVLMLLAVETARRLGVQLPTPFLLLYGGAALAAGHAGLKTALLTSTLVAGFVVYSSLQNFGPDSLTGGVIPVISGIVIAYAIGVAFGVRHDRNLRLTERLLESETNLTLAQSELTDVLNKRKGQLDESNSQLVVERSQLENALQYSPAGICVVGQDFRFASVNPAALKLFGLKTLPESWRALGQFRKHVSFITEDGDPIARDNGPVTEALRSGKTSDEFVCGIISLGGKVRWCRVCVAPIRAVDGSISGATLVLIDDTQKRTARRNLEDLIQRIITTQEREKQEIAHELHDGISQQLAAIKMNLHSAIRGKGRQPVIEDSIGQLDSAMRSIREISIGLRPAELDELGLAAAVRWYVSQQRQRTGQTIRFETATKIPDVSPDIATAYFRIVQEGVSNALEHAQATDLLVKMLCRNGRIGLEITDNGIGFNAKDRRIGGPAEPGFGLLSMKERAKSLDGYLGIESKPWAGTRVSACFPLVPVSKAPVD